MTTFWAKPLLLTLKRQDFEQFFFNCAKYGLDPELKQEQKHFQGRNRNKYRSFGSTTLVGHYKKDTNSKKLRKTEGIRSSEVSLWYRYLTYGTFSKRNRIVE
jgi:hypothetical protein